MSERKFVNVSRVIISQYDSYSLDGMIEELRYNYNQVPENCQSSVKFEIDMHSEPYCETEYPKMYMKYQRPETDLEMNKRIAEETVYLKAVQQNDFATYERLKKQFEG